MKTKIIKLGKKEIGDENPTFITFEAGATHNGFESAKKMLISAAKSGADAIKFQKVDPQRTCPDKTLMFEYEVLVDKVSGKVEKIKEPLQDILYRRYLSEDDFTELTKLSREFGIEIYATAQFVEDINFFKNLNFKTVKIGSTNLTNLKLIKAVAKAEMVLQVDTGMSQFSDIEKTIDFFISEGGREYIIHNCPSGYPAKIESINLNILPTLKKLFSMPVAFSDHSPGYEMDIAAVSKGANLIEKTITEDRSQRSVEHIMSLELNELDKFVSIIREVERAFGNPRRVLHKEEIIKKSKVKRCIQLNKDLPKGSYLSDEDIEMIIDSNGISYSMFNDLKKFSLIRDTKKLKILEYKDFKFD
jgi:N,N'-diacetyllegionaminate synthase